MATVIFTIFISISKTFIVKMSMTWTLTFRMSQGRCKYVNRKPIHDLLFDSNNNCYHVCQCLRDNCVRTSQLLSIRIFYLKIEGHEKQHGVLCHYMSTCVDYNLRKNIAGLSFVRGSPSKCTCIHYLCYAMLKMENFHLTLKISIKVQIWNAKINKIRQWSSSRKMNHDTLQSDVRCELYPWWINNKNKRPCWGSIY